MAPKRRKSSPLPNINLLFIAVLVLIGFAIYMQADTAALFTFAGSALAYLFGREHGRNERK